MNTSHQVTHPELLHKAVDAYGHVLPSLLKHRADFPSHDQLQKLIKDGSNVDPYSVGPGRAEIRRPRTGSFACSTATIRGQYGLRFGMDRVNWHKPFGVHDVEVADVDGDGWPDMLTMSDKNNLRWYRIASRRHSYNTKVHFTAQHLHLVLVARITGE